MEFFCPLKQKDNIVQTLLMIVGLLVLGLIALVFLFVFIKLLQSFDNQYESDEEFTNPTDNPNFDVTSFRAGLNQGVTITQMGLYKMWVDGGESMVVGTFDNLQTEVVQNISQFFTDNGKLKEWNEKFLKYIEAKQKEDPPK